MTDYRCEAPPFHVWIDGGVHELVSFSRDDLKRRMALGVERCTEKDCDWCNGKRELTVIKGASN
jgi:hypothetical protein